MPYISTIELNNKQEEDQKRKDLEKIIKEYGNEQNANAQELPLNMIEPLDYIGFHQTTSSMSKK